MFRLSYVAQFVQTDNDGNPTGVVFEVNGATLINTNAPLSTDITNAATAMGTDMGTKMAAAYPVQSAQDSSSDTGGGQG